MSGVPVGSSPSSSGCVTELLRRLSREGSLSCSCANLPAGDVECIVNVFLQAPAPAQYPTFSSQRPTWRTWHWVHLNSRLAQSKSNIGPGEPPVLQWHVPATPQAHDPRWSYSFRGRNSYLAHPEHLLALYTLTLVAGLIKASTRWKGEPSQTSGLLFFSCMNSYSSNLSNKITISSWFQPSKLIFEAWRDVLGCMAAFTTAMWILIDDIYHDRCSRMNCESFFQIMYRQTYLVGASSGSRTMNLHSLTKKCIDCIGKQLDNPPHCSRLLGFMPRQE